MEHGELTWVRSPRSSSGQPECVEVARLPDGGVAIRNSREPDAPPLVYTPSEWEAFVAGIKDGSFDGIIRASRRGA